MVDAFYKKKDIISPASSGLYDGGERLGKELRYESSVLW